MSGTLSAQDAVAAYMLALRQSSADRPRGQTADNEDEGLRIDTPNQVQHRATCLPAIYSQLEGTLLKR